MTVPPEHSGPQPDDETLAALVRDVADRWSMPPQRLDDRTWRERVSGQPRRRRARATAAGWLRRLGTAASVAVVATVALALVAVWLTIPRTPAIGNRTSAPPTLGQTPESRQTPSLPPATPLPAYAVYGQKLDGRLILNVSGVYRIVDLATGTFAGDLVKGTQYPTQLFARPGGGFVCACFSAAYAGDYLSGSYTIDARVLRRDGSLIRQVRVAKLQSDTDPVVSDDESNGLSAAAELAPDGRTLYVAWAYRRTPVWHTGISVVDVERGKVVQTIRLPDRSSTDGLIVTSVWLNALRIAPDGGHLMLTMDVYSTRSHTTPHVLATVADGRIAQTVTLPDNTAINEHPCDPGGGFATNTTYYTLCPSPAVYRLFALDGSLIAQAELGRGSGAEPGTADIVDRARGQIFHWSSETRTLSRIDLATGRVTGTATALQASSGPARPVDGLAALGRSVGGWLAPSVMAKTILQPGIVLSPDGSRIYALGTTTPATTDPGSTGVDVFDAVAMRPIDHWEPPADLVSVATSPDGRYVYVAGAPDVNASGERTGAPASLIVFEASTGSVRMIAGALGSEMASIVP